jgi:septum formation protein
MKKLILASTSPRRRQLLAKIGIPFVVLQSDYEENMSLPLSPHELVQHLSQGKAEAVAKNLMEGCVIGADTVVVFEGKIMGKPHIPKRAREMLKALSGKENSIVTGFTILDCDQKRSISDSEETRIFFRPLSDEEIEHYIATGEPLERAGAYSIQEGAADFVERYEGDYDNAVGLPVSKIASCLKQFGFEV